MTPIPRLRPGTWLRRTTDRWELVNVVDTTPDGGVTILLDGVRINTTKQYLLNAWCHLEGER